MCLYCSMAEAGDSVYSGQRTKTKEIENGFMRLSCDTQPGTQLICLFFKGNNYLLYTYVFFFHPIEIMKKEDYVKIKENMKSAK